MYLAHAVHIVRCKVADLCWRLYLRNFSIDRQRDRQTHGRGYMHLAQAVHIVYCKAADLCWDVDLSLELVHRTHRHTDGAICTWINLYIVRLLLVCAGCGYMNLAQSVHIVYCKAAHQFWHL